MKNIFRFLLFLIIGIVSCNQDDKSNDEKNLAILALAASSTSSNSTSSNDSCDGDISRDWGVFTDMNDGTVKLVVTPGTYGGNSYSSKTLYFAKCTHGKTYNSGSNTCTGSGTLISYCSAADSSCDDGSILNGTGTSEAWDACNNLSLAGKSWRVPTKDELKLLIECNDKTMPNDNDSCGEGNYPSNSLVPAVNCLFEDDTISSYNYWSSSAHSTYSYFAWLVQFGSGYNFSFNKNYIGYVRCVSE